MKKPILTGTPCIKFKNATLGRRADCYYSLHYVMKYQPFLKSVFNYFEIVSRACNVTPSEDLFYNSFDVISCRRS